MLRQIERMSDENDFLRKEVVDKKELKISYEELKKRFDSLQSNHDLLMEEKDNLLSVSFIFILFIIMINFFFSTGYITKGFFICNSSTTIRIDNYNFKSQT